MNFTVPRDFLRAVYFGRKDFSVWENYGIMGKMAEEGTFLLLAWLLRDVMTGLALDLVPMAIARVVSSLLDFYVNQKMVFKSSHSIFSAFVRYFVLAIPLAVAQVAMTYGGYELFSIREAQVMLRGAIYATVMIVLFVVSFLVQKFWVFSAAKEVERGEVE